jgi:hypothetical protein
MDPTSGARASAGVLWMPSSGDGLDLLAWAFQRTLEESPRSKGPTTVVTSTSCSGAGLPLPIEGDDKTEYGLNATWKFGNFFGFLQYVDQEIAGLGRTGGEVVAGWNIPLPGLFAAWDRPVINWIRPTVRYSYIDNDFQVDGPFITPSMFWDWTKIDLGVRVGIVRNVDLTLEWALNDAELLDGSSLSPDEFLGTLRIGW